VPARSPHRRDLRRLLTLRHTLKSHSRK